MASVLAKKWFIFFVLTSLGKCDPQGIDPKEFNGPSPSKGKGIKSHTNQMGFAFNVV
jgi:hypothetical protein